MRRSSPYSMLLALSVLVLAAAWHDLPLLACLESCVADLPALHGEATGRAELADVRLNAWILAWVQHALLASPGDLFHANAFHPATDALAGSEHLIVPALLVLPVRLLAGDPLALHQASTALSSLLLAVTVFAFVRFATGSAWAALLAGAVAVHMPWRTAELAHVQILNVQWLPLVWLFAARLLLGEDSGGGLGSAAGLAVALALQLLSSAYLAYYTLLSLAVFALVLIAGERRARARLRPLLASLVAPLLLLVLASLPYLARASTGEAAPRAGPEWYSLGLDAWRFLVPRAAPEGPIPATYGYRLPLPVLAFALAALALPARAPARRASAAAAAGAGADPARRHRLLSASLFAVAIACFVMMIGREAEIAGRAIPMPGALAARLVPGFEFLGTPLRWAVVIGVAAPILAGLGVAALDRLVARLAAGSRVALPAWRAAALGFFLAGVPWTEVPARAAWPENDPVRATHEVIAELGRGPVLELPWALQRVRAMELESRYMLASARHWNPILNGFTAYRPASYALLRRVAQDLPEPEALARLRALVSLRFIVVHPAALSPRERRAWAEPAPGRAGLRLVRELEGARIYEVSDWRRGGQLAPALLEPERSETLSGLPRRPLRLAAGAGRLEAEIPAALTARPLAPLRRLAVRVTNQTKLAWPGFDAWEEGLLRLRYVFRDADGEVAVEGSAPLDADVPPHTTRELRPWIEMPSQPGRYRLRLELVQRVAGALRPLPVAAVERELRVRAPGAGGAAP